eukprot:scaffold8.g1552.t1
MGGYVGTVQDEKRIRRQEAEREEQRRQYEEAKRKAAVGAGLREFGAGTSEAVENAFKAETIGLVTRQEFVEKRATIADRLEEERKKKRLQAEDEALREKERQRAKKAKSERRHKLSFDDFGEEEEEEGADEPATAPPPLKLQAAQPQEAAAAEAAKPAGEAAQPSTSGGGGGGANGNGDGGGRPRFATLGKDPSVHTDFLPDKDRERAEEELREKLKQEYTLRQAAIKAEPLEITYSYYNGTGHRRTVTVRKGDTISQFLKAVIEQLKGQFRELRNATSSNLMYVKEDIIMPHNMSFYELIINKAQGRSGPLFQFDLQEHAIAAFDPRMKSQDSHAGKVVDRHWYNHNKHIFPASHWEVFDEEKAFRTQKW